MKSDLQKKVAVVILTLVFAVIGASYIVGGDSISHDLPVDPVLERFGDAEREPQVRILPPHNSTNI